MLIVRPREDSCSPASGVYEKSVWKSQSGPGGGKKRARAREEKKRLSLRAPMEAQLRRGDFAGNVSQNNVKTAARPGVSRPRGNT